MSDSLKRTPLHRMHKDLGARMIEFGGWEMPVQYESLILEHRAVRNRAGIFDLSHMGEFYFSGSDAARNLNRILTNDVERLSPGRAQYTLICNDAGGIVDDVVLYRLKEREFMLVVNAANIEKDRFWIEARLEGDVTFADRSFETALIAVQGPMAEPVVSGIAGRGITDLRSFEAAEASAGDMRILVSRTGYTGEDGFELYCDADRADDLWRRITEADDQMTPVGLGARDTLRLEARLPLYGNDLSDETTPLEAGLKFAVKLEKEAFIGREALLEQEKAGPARRLVGFVMFDRGGAPRHGYPIVKDGRPIGEVTSGTFSPTLEKEIGMGYVSAEFAAPGTPLEVEVRKKARAGEVIKGRFVVTKSNPPK